MEKESRIREQEVPAKALQFIKSAQVESTVKWYLEEGMEKSSMEAKFKKDRKRFSIEFDMSGNVEDIEIELRVDEIPENVSRAIDKQFQQNCTKHRIIKVQIQYSGSESVLTEKMKSGKLPPDIITKYEIVVNCRTEKGPELLEYLFNEKGETISVTKIIFKPSSNLEY